MRLGTLRAIASLSLAAALSCTGVGLAAAQETAQGAVQADEGLSAPAVEAAGCAPSGDGRTAPDGTAANGQATGGLAANDVTTGAVTDAVTGRPPRATLWPTILPRMAPWPAGLPRMEA